MNNELVQKYHGLFLANRNVYMKMDNYYNGITDAMETYKMVTERSNLKVNCNFLKKFIKEETSYSVGNDITYISRSSDKGIIDTIGLNFQTLSTQHDIELMKTMLKFNIAYELYYIDEEEFKSKVISPLEGFLIKQNNVVIGFGREYMVEGIDDELYLDIYTQSSIHHYKVGEQYVEDKDATPNIFGFIPVGISRLGLQDYDDGRFDTLYNDIKGLQDAYETNLSDLTNEISDFRNAYLVLTGAQLDEGQAASMKQMGILQTDDPNAKFEWLIKNLNDTFIQNTLSTLEDKMYQLSQHINHNEKLQSNLSGVNMLRSA
jgi:SPP1 family phage portal protein